MIQQTKVTATRNLLAGRAWPWALGLAVAGGLTANVQAALEGETRTAAAPDKSTYNLFNPTPRELMREMSTDRPDQTESPYTVDAGHFQMEMDFVNATFDRDKSGGGDVRTEVWGVAPLNLKLGLLNNVDIQFVLDTYTHSRVEDRVANTVDRASGFGDLQTRLKINLWGNDGGSTAFAMMPFVKWPLPESSLRNGETEGGVIFILGYELPAGWGSAVMTEFDFVSDGAGGYEAEFVNSITFSHDIVGDLGGYVEFFTVTGSAPGFKWQGQVDVGLTYALNKNTQLDLGCNFGVTKAAPDFNPFVGLSWRF
jgi:Putative MetA-pathway of phenol degradation